MAVALPLHVCLTGTMNALSLKDLAAKTHGGLHGRVEVGRAAGGISFGDRVRTEDDAKGEAIRGSRSSGIQPAKVKTALATDMDVLS